MPSGRRSPIDVTRIYDIGPFRLDSEAGVLTKAGAPMPLGARAVAVLATLVERRIVSSGLSPRSRTRRTTGIAASARIYPSR